jgi:hypothetical protein
VTSSAEPAPPGAAPRKRLAAAFAVDRRSLALFRVGLALLLLHDSLDRAGGLVAFYTDAGVLPAALLPHLGRAASYSLHAFASPWPSLVALLFAAQVALALALLVGWRTGPATALSWLLLASLQLRNPLLAYSGGDKLLRHLLFFSIFAPLGSRFSLDARRRPEPGPAELRSLAAAALLLQVAIVYWSNGLNKLGGAWLAGTALADALETGFFRGPFASELRGQAWLLAPASVATPLVELLGPFLAFSPWRRDLGRLAAVGLFVGFHLTLLAVFDIGSFPAVCIVAWTAFLPARFWELVARARRAPSAGAAQEGGASASPPRSRRALEWLAAGCLAYVVLQVGAGHLGLRLPRALEAAGAALRLQQHWGQFEDVTSVDFWPALRGTTASGRAVDPLRGGPALEGRPASVTGLFPDFRWRIYFFGLIKRSLLDPRDPGLAPLVAELVDYLCRDWNRTHAGPERLDGVEVAFLVEVPDLSRFRAPQAAFRTERSCAAGS